MKPIKPTVGRVVHYYPNKAEAGPPGTVMELGSPRAAIITEVWGERCVNLTVFDANGRIDEPGGHTSVPLVQPDEPEPDPQEGGYCTWMPYQLGQAERTAEAERRAGIEDPDE